MRVYKFVTVPLQKSEMCVWKGGICLGVTGRRAEEWAEGTDRVRRDKE